MCFDVSADLGTLMGQRLSASVGVTDRTDGATVVTQIFFGVTAVGETKRQHKHNSDTEV